MKTIILVLFVLAVSSCYLTPESEPGYIRVTFSFPTVTAWDSTTVYPLGMLVTYPDDSTFYESRQEGNLGNIPDASDDWWRLVF